MVTRNELRKRQMIWAEYRAGNNKEQAHSNLTKKLGPGSISLDTIESFYERFRRIGTSLFDKEDEQYGISQAIQTMPNGDEVKSF
jgi:hypothetical protein